MRHRGVISTTALVCLAATTTVQATLSARERTSARGRKEPPIGPIIGLRQSVEWNAWKSQQYHAGDWDGDGFHEIAVISGGIHYTDGIKRADIHTVAFGENLGDEYLVGNWDGVGGDEFAVRSGNTLRLQTSIGSSDVWKVVRFGSEEHGANLEYYAGDWNGDGRDTFAIRQSNNDFHLMEDLTPEEMTQPSVGGRTWHVYRFGVAGDEYLVGNWNLGGGDTLATLRGNQLDAMRDPTPAQLVQTVVDGTTWRVARYGGGENQVLSGRFLSGPQGWCLASRRGPVIHIQDGFTSGDAAFRITLGVR